MDFLTDYILIFRRNILLFAVAERSKASDHCRSFGWKLKWGPGGQHFFLFFKNSILSQFLFLPCIFDPYIIFLESYVAIFPKLVPLFSAEPTVPYTKKKNLDM